MSRVRWLAGGMCSNHHHIIATLSWTVNTLSPGIHWNKLLGVLILRTVLHDDGGFRLSQTSCNWRQNLQSKCEICIWKTLGADAVDGTVHTLADSRAMIWLLSVYRGRLPSRSEAFSRQLWACSLILIFLLKIVAHFFMCVNVNQS